MNENQTLNEATARPAVRSTDGLAEALRAVIKLVDDGVLVRNIENDHDASQYLKQAMRLTCVLQNAQVALASANGVLNDGAK